MAERVGVKEGVREKVERYIPSAVFLAFGFAALGQGSLAWAALGIGLGVVFWPKPAS